MKRILFISLLLTICFVSINPSDFYKSDPPLFSLSVKAFQSNFKIKQKNPVVNENNRIVLSTIDSSGANINGGVAWSSGNNDVALVNPTTGEVLGVKTGFATITAKRGSETSSVFVVVARVRKASGAQVPGDTKFDSSGSIYISNPIQNIILKADKSLNTPLQVYAGTTKVAGNRNGRLEESLFAGPTAIGVNNSVNGGLYVADTLNHSIRKVGFNKQVETIMGSGSPGVSLFSDTGLNFENVRLSSPRGVVSDAGGNFYIADTDNHAIYYADMARQKVFLLAGEPGQSGKSDGIGRNSRFRRPSGMALSNDGRLLTIADEDNNRVRLVDISRDSQGNLTGTVSTLGAASLQGVASDFSALVEEEFIFDQPQSVGIDGTGNIYVVDNKGVQLVTRTQGQTPQIMPLAQEETSFNKAVSVTLKGTEAFVLDNGSSDSESLKIVSVGGPEIGSVEPSLVNLNETRDIVIRGKSFAPESQVVVNGQLAQNVRVVNAEEIRFRLPSQNAPGKLTLSVLTRGGISQLPLDIVAKPGSMINTGEITTIAGGRSFNGDGGKADQGSLAFFDKAVVDGNGNLFIADSLSIRKVDTQTKIITTVVGGGESFADGILANTAKIMPKSIVVDKSGNLFIADGFTRRVRRVDALTNLITTFAGKEDRKFGGDGGQAINAGFDNISDLVFDSKNNLLVLEPTRLRRIDVNGVITTTAGNGSNKFSGDGGQAINAGFGDAFSVDVNAKGDIFIAELLSGRIRRIDSNGVINTIVGNGKKIAVKKDREGKLATKVSLVNPLSVAVTDNTLFFTDLSRSVAISKGETFLTNTISKVDLTTGRISSQQVKLSNFGTIPFNFSIDGQITLDGLGNIFFGGNGFVYGLNPSTGEAKLLAGTQKFNFTEDGKDAQVSSLGVALDSSFDSKNNLYIADLSNGQIKKVDSQTNIVTTVVGKTPTTVGNGDGGDPLNAVIKPLAIDVDSQDNLIILERKGVGAQLRKVNFQAKTITTIAGNGTNDSGDNGLATQAGISPAFNLTLDSSDNIFFVTQNRNLRKIDSKTNIITTVTKVGSPFSTLAFDKSGNIIASENTNFLRRVDLATGNVTVFAGGDSSMGISGDGGAVSQAGLGVVTSLTSDKAGNLFIVSEFSEVGDDNRLTVVRKVDAQTNIINTIAGNKTAKSGERDYKGDGAEAIDANLGSVRKVTMDKKGNLYLVVSDSFFNSVRLVKLSQ